MADTIYLPRINAVDHETFRRICDAYPADTYDKWLYFQAQEIAEIKRRGDVVELVDVSPDDFIRYGDAVGAKRNIHALRVIPLFKIRDLA